MQPAQGRKAAFPGFLAAGNEQRKPKGADGFRSLSSVPSDLCRIRLRASCRSQRLNDEIPIGLAQISCSGSGSTMRRKPSSSARSGNDLPGGCCYEGTNPFIQALHLDGNPALATPSDYFPSNLTAPCPCPSVGRGYSRPFVAKRGFSTPRRRARRTTSITFP